MPEQDTRALTLVLGGARSGKSRYGEALTESAGATCIYIATAEARDHEMAVRIREHRARRGSRWRTVEAPFDLAGALLEADGPGRAILVDCLTLWLANLMEAGRDVAAETAGLVAALRKIAAPVALVSNEVGLGVVPENALGRAFRDHAGQMNQAIAAEARVVVLMVAGMPVPVKPSLREFLGS